MAPVKLRLWDTEMIVEGPSKITDSSIAVHIHGSSAPGGDDGAVAELAQPGQRLVTDEHAEQRSRRGAVAPVERVAISTRASARRCEAVRTTPLRLSAR